MNLDCVFPTLSSNFETYMPILYRQYSVEVILVGFIMDKLLFLITEYLSCRQAMSASYVGKRQTWLIRANEVQRFVCLWNFVCPIKFMHTTQCSWTAFQVKCPSFQHVSLRMISICKVHEGSVNNLQNLENIEYRNIHIWMKRPKSMSIEFIIIIKHQQCDIFALSRLHRSNFKLRST